jgi:hypothetical protein
MAKKYICNACDTFYDSTHKRDRVCSICTATPPCTKDGSMYCATCNKWFLSEKCFQNHLTHKVKVKLAFRWRQVCPNCSFTVTCDNKHESFKRFCNYCNKKQLSGHSSYVAPLNPSKLTNRFMYVSFIWSAHRTLKSTMDPLNMFLTPCAQQMFSKCERCMT